MAAAKAKAAVWVVAAVWAAGAGAAQEKAAAVVWAWGRARVGSLTRGRRRTYYAMTRKEAGPCRWRAANP